MRKKSIKKIVLYITIMVITLALNYIILESKITAPVQNEYNLKLSILADKKDNFQIFYKEKGAFSEIDSYTYEYLNNANWDILSINIPSKTTAIRIDTGTKLGIVKIKNINISKLNRKVNLTNVICENLKPNQINQINQIEKRDNYLEIKNIGNDPYIIINFSENIIEKFHSIEQKINILYKYGIILILDIFLIGLLVFRKIIKNYVLFLHENKLQIWNLSKNDFKTRYVGSYFGVFWAFVQPVITILIYWFVFQIGFRVPPIKEFPYLLWFMPGIIPWFLFADIISLSTNCLYEYSYLVKKVVFNIDILPIIKALTAMFVHLFFLILIYGVYGIYGFSYDFYCLQLIYYSLCTFILGLAISYMFSSAVVFIKDLGQVIGIVLQFGVWLTPIMWNINMIPENLRWVIKLNPVYYIVEGYRDSLLDKVWFWQKPIFTLYFWIIALILFIMGKFIFKRLKPHFADVL